MYRALTRRDVFLWATSAAALQGCGLFTHVEPREPTLKLPDEIPAGDAKPKSVYGDSVDALFDVLLPVELDAHGAVVSAGAREAGVDQVLETEHFVRLAIAQGFLMPLREEVLVALDDLGGSARQALNGVLDARAQLERPNARFHELPRSTQERIADKAFDDDATKPLMLAARAACFTAYLGAVSSDVGLREVGFPAFENFAEGLAVSGYPRMTNGKLDDYTFNRVPQATVGDDLSLILTPEGDLR